MKKKNTYWLIAGLISTISFFIHLILGQSTLINPLLESKLTLQVKTELLGVWHMISLILFATSFLYFYYSIKNVISSITICLLSNLYLAFGVIFIISGLINSVFTPQWILLIPIGIFGLLGIKKHTI